MQTEKTFENVDKINQEIKNEAVKNHRVEKRHHRPFLEHALLGQDDPQSAANPIGEMVEANIRLTPGDGPVNVVKPRAAIIQRAGGKQNKQDLFECRQHRGATALRFNSYLTLTARRLSKYWARNYH